jgi:amino acid transporter
MMLFLIYYLMQNCKNSKLSGMAGMKSIKIKKKFGTFKGVFVPSTEAILGTVLFLLLPTLTADVGLIPILAVIILAHSVTIATSFSLADCATNLNNIGGGGMYALSKRSLGKAFGGSIGIQLYIAQAASIGFYSIGFVEPLYPFIAPLLSSFPMFQGSDPGMLLFQKQILASAVFILFFTIVIFGADFTLKIQMVILLVLLSSITVILLSPLTGISYNSLPVFNSLESLNLFGNRVLSFPLFFLVFTQFFPAVTGIDAGVGMSGDLKDPKKSLVRGTFIAIVITFMVYMLSACTFALIKKDLLITGYENNIASGFLLTELLGINSPFPGNIIGLIILLGILFATSSSALSCFMTAPRTAQSLSRDKTLPSFFNFLKYDFVKDGNEPRFATLITFFIGLSVIWIGNINIAAMIVGISFLLVYGWVNGAAFLERISGNPTFRPTSKGHWIISLYGFLASIVSIVLFNWLIGVLLIILQLIIFSLILRYKSKNKLEGVWWGAVFSFVTRGLRLLGGIVEGAKNWRPILTAIAFSDKHNCPNKIAFLAETTAAFKGLVNLNIIRSDKHEGEEYDISGFNIPTNVVYESDYNAAILSIVQSSNPSGLKPNTFLIEFERRINTTMIIKRLLAMHKNILVLQNGEKLDVPRRIDIWWRHELNGNLMLFLAYIIHSSLKITGKNTKSIRIIRKLTEEEESEEKIRGRLEILVEKSRLEGEIIILPFSKEPFDTTLAAHSKETDLIMLGMPGKYEEERRIFNLDEFFFDREIDKYDHYPPILFVKSYRTVNLIED